MQITCIMRTNIYKEKICALLKKEHLLTIAQIHEAIPDADYSTIFRNIEQLHKDKIIKKVVVDTKSIAYEASDGSHDHFICNDCGMIESISIPHSSITSHKVEDITVRGSCDKCNT